MAWKKLVTLEDCEYIMHGAIFRVKGVWPYEEFVDFMLVDMADDRTRHALVVSSGRKAGLVLVRLPLDSGSPTGNTLSRKWLIENWGKWVYPQCSVQDVFFLPRYEAQDPE
ncbi:hypothetical protein J2X56_003145 [Herbaspirillum sp. 1173]|uniref:Imm45 family immunity protein n=1 Tax=Herbaspirillum sp. 1173 TaxID=2817734 RepID=UPI00285AA671|nr:Imm45 family immunity protein [Herbaspirillum sp. 1173]MDR6741121.1 hypothetical protein [Herbaspirillum sp. 1173]